MAEIKSYQGFENNEAYTVTRTDDKIIVRKKAEKYIYNERGDETDRREYVPEEYVYNSQGEFIGGYRQSLRISNYKENDRGDLVRYGERPYKKVVYNPVEGGYQKLTYETVEKKTGAETVKLMENEKFQYGERTSYQYKKKSNAHAREEYRKKGGPGQTIRGEV